MGSIRQIKPRSFGIGICEICGKEFVRKAGNHRFCCVECQRKSYEESCKIADDSLPKTPPPDLWRQCKTCGKLFKLKYKGSRALYCSDECKKEAAKQRAAEKKYKRSRWAGKENRKPRKSTIPPQPKDGFTWAEIRAVLGEYGISSYQKAVQILQQRKREQKGGGEND